MASSVLTREIRPRQSIANGEDLRVLPLGDSITYGEGSSDGNGYRLALATTIKDDGNHLNYIGQVKSGTMGNNRHEGHGGFPIGPVGNTAKPDYPERPNVILLMAGTNDIIFKVDVPNAPKRLSTVIGAAVAACPDAAILVGTLLPLIHPKENPQLSSTDTEAFNSGLLEAVEKYNKEGKHVAVVDMARVNASHISPTDGIHPTDEGYALIAAAWHDGLIVAGAKGWIQQPFPESSESQQNGASEHNGHSSVGSLGSATSNGSTISKAWTLENLMVGLLILFGVLCLARKALVHYGWMYKG
ncbi:MAG: hypothetical protein L6R37_006228 [Teloschistes peruensis]|nr:MAG: hypothetical protein L6R37_006228 [Teloschistes peruensis]